MKIDKQWIVHVAVTSLPMKTFLAAVARALGLRLVKLTQLIHANMVVMDKDETDCVLTTAYAAATHLKKPGKTTWLNPIHLEKHMDRWNTIVWVYVFILFSVKYDHSVCRSLMVELFALQFYPSSGCCKAISLRSSYLWEALPSSRLQMPPPPTPPIRRERPEILLSQHQVHN